MKLPSKFVEWVARLWPNSHRRFEEMSVLAVTGQLDGLRMCELNDHISVCVSCRQFLESAAQISVRTMPLLADSRAPAADIVPPAGMQARFLSRFAYEEVHGEAAPISSFFPESPAYLPIVERRRPGRNGAGEVRPGGPRFNRIAQRKWLTVAVAVCLAVGVAGFYFGKRTARPVPMQMLSASAPVTPVNTAGDISDRILQLERQKSSLQGELAQLKRKLSNASSEQKSLSGELATARDKFAAYTAQAQISLRRSLAEGAQAKNQVAVLQGQVDKLNQQLAEAAFQLAVQKQEAGDLAAKLEITQTELQNARELKSAKSEFADLLAARNLHIVDVYDADPSGKRQRSFGRVFYIEGKSLVFYAYDLDDPGRFKTNVVFHVWGGKAGFKEVTHSLGILHKDDGGQARWSMTFDDPRVLSKINSVFVTAEASNKHYEGPHGKKVLYAYFGSQPNHP